MADDAVFMVPGAEPFGRDAFAAASDGMKGALFDGAVEVKELRILGDRAWLRAHIRIEITPPGGAAAVRRSGHALSILRREGDGQWRLARDANLLTEET